MLTFDRATAWVVTGNDFPEAIYATEADAVAHCERMKAEDAARQEGYGPAVYWRAREVQAKGFGGDVGQFLNALRDIVHDRNVEAGWWSDLRTGERVDRNFGELIALVHSELSEGLEGHRKNLPDDKLPHRPMTEVEMADAVIRILDLCGGFKFDLGGALVEKMEFNRTRQDHSREARLGANGKKI